MPSPESIFISYRRSDSNAEAGRIYDRLVLHFGRDHVFKDVDSITPGVDFADLLDKAIRVCDVALVLIGKTWLEVANPDGSRCLDNPKDFVRREVEAALGRGVHVIPVLLEGASMPSSDQLPETMRPLSRSNASLVGHDPRFHSDMDRLIKRIERVLGFSQKPSERATEPPSFTFDQVTIVGVDKGGFLGLGKPSLRTARRSGQAEYHREDLGNGIALDLVQIPSGSFMMGAPEDEGERLDRESPQHRVNVSKFWMGKYTVTQFQWKAVAVLPKVGRDLDPDPSKFKGGILPVEQVSWSDAIEFCQRLSKKTGRDYRLPSEAEWEYACRAGTTTPFHFGETITADLVNHDGNYTYGSGPKGSYRQQTTPVGSFKAANAFGLYDMHGNVWEWCMDEWHEDYWGAPTDGSAWLSSEKRKLHVVRGGSWDDYPWYCRSAYRSGFYPVNRLNRIGFRVCCSPPRILL